MPKQTMFSIDDIKSRHKGYWFTSDTMRFFDSRAMPDVFPMEDGSALFISSERQSEESPRRYTVRKCDGMTGSIDTVGGFQQHASLVQARNHARMHARTPAACVFCEE